MGSISVESPIGNDLGSQLYLHEITQNQISPNSFKIRKPPINIIHKINVIPKSKLKIYVPIDEETCVNKLLDNKIKRKDVFIYNYNDQIDDEYSNYMLSKFNCSMKNEKAEEAVLALPLYIKLAKLKEARKNVENYRVIGAGRTIGIGKYGEPVSCISTAKSGGLLLRNLQRLSTESNDTEVIPNGTSKYDMSSIYRVSEKRDIRSTIGINDELREYRESRASRKSLGAVDASLKRATLANGSFENQIPASTDKIQESNISRSSRIANVQSLREASEYQNVNELVSSTRFSEVIPAELRYSSRFSQAVQPTLRASSRFSQPAPAELRPLSRYSQPAQVESTPSSIFQQAAQAGVRSQSRFSQPVQVELRPSVFPQAPQTELIPQSRFSQPAYAESRPLSRFSQAAQDELRSQSRFSQAAQDELRSQSRFSQAAQAESRPSSTFPQATQDKLRSQSRFSQAAQAESRPSSRFSQAAQAESRSSSPQAAQDELRSQSRLSQAIQAGSRPSSRFLQATQDELRSQSRLSQAVQAASRPSSRFSQAAQDELRSQSRFSQAAQAESRPSSIFPQATQDELRSQSRFSQAVQAESRPSSRFSQAAQDELRSQSRFSQAAQAESRPSSIFPEATQDELRSQLRFSQAAPRASSRFSQAAEAELRSQSRFSQAAPRPSSRFSQAAEAELRSQSRFSQAAPRPSSRFSQAAEAELRSQSRFSQAAPRLSSRFSQAAEAELRSQSRVSQAAQNELRSQSRFSQAAQEESRPSSIFPQATQEELRSQLRFSQAAPRASSRVSQAVQNELRSPSRFSQANLRPSTRFSRGVLAELNNSNQIESRFSEAHYESEHSIHDDIKRGQIFRIPKRLADLHSVLENKNHQINSQHVLLTKALLPQYLCDEDKIIYLTPGRIFQLLIDLRYLLENDECINTSGQLILKAIAFSSKGKITWTKKEMPKKIRKLITDLTDNTPLDNSQLALARFLVGNPIFSSNVPDSHLKEKLKSFSKALKTCKPLSRYNYNIALTLGVIPSLLEEECSVNPNSKDKKNQNNHVSNHSPAVSTHLTAGEISTTSIHSTVASRPLPADGISTTNKLSTKVMPSKADIHHDDRLSSGYKISNEIINSDKNNETLSAKKKNETRATFTNLNRFAELHITKPRTLEEYDFYKWLEDENNSILNFRQPNKIPNRFATTEKSVKKLIKQYQIRCNQNNYHLSNFAQQCRYSSQQLRIVKQRLLQMRRFYEC